MSFFDLKNTKLYKQEAKSGTYQSLLWCNVMEQPMLKYLPANYGEVFVYFKQNDIGIFHHEKNFEAMAKAAIEVSKAEGDLPKTWRDKWRAIDVELTAQAQKVSRLAIDAMSVEELRAEYEHMFALDQEMWAMSVWLDSFDSGFDQVEFDRVAKLHGLTSEEIEVLVTPTEPSFLTEWYTALDEVNRGVRTKESLHDDYFWMGTNYYIFGELTDALVHKALAEKHDLRFESPLAREQEILASRNLTQNPLQMFRTFTIWRDIRKRLDYVGIYGLLRILRGVLARRGIAPELANALLLEQVPQAFDGTILQEVLQRQFTDGVLLHAKPTGEMQYYFGKEAQDAWDELNTFYLGTKKNQEIKGMSASRGTATGLVRVVLEANSPEAREMQKGEILVTSMTRPEFLPLMHLCAAIITNEGGITSHAAIVSRELRKPCIIGTHIATVSLKTGDKVEVDANAGIVTILERA